MTTLENTPIKKLIELYNFMFPDPDGDGSYLLDAAEEIGEDFIRGLLLIDIEPVLREEYGYNGPNDYNSMFWFAKGAKPYYDAEQLHRKQKKADDELFKNINNKYKENKTINPLDKVDDDRRKQLQNKFEQQRIKEVNDYRIREQKKADDELFKDINKKYKRSNRNRLIDEYLSVRDDIEKKTMTLDEFEDDISSSTFIPLDLLDKVDNKKREQLQNKFEQKRFQEIDDYKKWNEDKIKQDKIVEDIMERLERTPTNWYLNFEELNNYGKEQIFPKLLEFFHEHIDTLPIIEKYKLKYEVNGEWKTLTFTPENYKKLMDNFTKQNFILDIDETPPEYFYEQGKEELPAWCLFSAIVFTKYKGYKGNNDVGGSFFQYLTTDKVPIKVIDYLKRLQIFDSLVNNKNKQREELNDCCFIYALKQTGSYTEDELNKIRLRINNRYLSQSSINSLCEEFKIKIKLTYINESAKCKKQTVRSGENKKYKSFMGFKDAEPKYTHTFNIFENHYFIEEKTPFSNYYIKNLNQNIEPDKFDKEYNVDHWRKSRQYISSSNLVRELFKQGYFKPITFGQYKVLDTVFHNEIDPDISNINLEYNPDSCTKLIAPLKTKTNPNAVDPTYWYADFEADVSGDIHKPFMCVLQSQNGKINKEFRGEDCNVQLLEYLPNGAVIYFHNLGYDIRMLAKYGIFKSIIKGTKTMKADIKHKGKTLHFKDTLPVLDCKLSQLPQMFDISDIQKEIFPYKYYTLERLKSNKGIINEAGLLEDKIWTTEDYKLFNSNIDKIPGCRIDENTFDMWKYASFYCQQDVNILRLGFNKFRDGFINDFNIDPFNYISISSLANEVFNQRVYYPNRNLYKIGGHVRKFCSHAVYGGRCMTAYNKKWHITKPLCDFDAVSLYPSAMARLYTVEGKPEVINVNEVNANRDKFLKDFTDKGAYIVEIKITKINKHYPFPLIVRKVNGLNLNDDNLAEGETINMVVDNITLEDLIEYQQIEFEIIRGYAWYGKRDYTIQKEIRKIFNKRLEYKKQKNPLQQLYKLIMNSCYGKTIERPIEKDHKYFDNEEDLNKYWIKNYYKIVEDIEIADSNIHAVKTLKPIDKHFNFSLLGIQVLSMSKRIMNEVMCLAYDLGCHIYYQDTDSMHIEIDDLPRLVNAFKEKYNRELIGSNLGQFHSDFPTINNHDEIPVSIESYFLMKKMYIDKLQDSTKQIDYMIRGKGLTQASINYAADRWHHGNYMSLYRSIYEGKSQTFDLTKGQPCFSMNKNMTVSTVKAFSRTIKTTYEEGKRSEYFNK